MFVLHTHKHTRKSCVFHQQALVSLTPYSPRTLRTSPLPTHHALCPPPSLSSAPLLFHSPTLTLRQTMRRSRSAAQVAHNEKCRMQKTKKKRSGNRNRNEWHVKHSEPSPKNLRSSFLSFCSVCVCVCVFCICIVFLLAILFCANLCRALLGRPQ